METPAHPFYDKTVSIAKLWNQLMCLSTDRMKKKWIKKVWYLYTKEFYSAIKNKIMASVEKWLGLESIMLDEMSDS
jgi:hypothetical protein